MGYVGSVLRTVLGVGFARARYVELSIYSCIYL